MKMLQLALKLINQVFIQAIKKLSFIFLLQLNYETYQTTYSMKRRRFVCKSDIVRLLMQVHFEPFKHLLTWSRRIIWCVLSYFARFFCSFVLRLIVKSASIILTFVHWHAEPPRKQIILEEDIWFLSFL